MLSLPIMALALALQAPQPVRIEGPQPTSVALAADTGSLHHSNGRTPPVATARRLERSAGQATPTINLDGHLDEAAWSSVEPATEFTQMNPHEGEPATERTEVRFLYDDDAIYVGARMFDSDAKGIRTQLARRDDHTAADNFQVAFDSYHDHQSSFVFGVNPSGVKTDYLLGNDGYSFTHSWDPVWSVATSRDSLGWVVEMRIPFSQLRFPARAKQVWGVNITRHIERKAEDVRFAWSRPSDRGFSSFFGHLFGLANLPQPRRLELLPYATARQERVDPGTPNNPFNNGTRDFSNAGMDLKYGLTSNITLDATFNPDFGQVEADPAFVNLTAFEQFFDEKRPFFIEGTDIFQTGSQQQYFYSRRIGRPPQGSADDRGGYVDQPQNATILGAAKLSGRTAGGWSIGLLDAATQREFAAVDSSGVRFHDQVEPFTNYLVTRAKKDFRGGSDQVGLMMTAVNRSIDTPALAFLRDAAYAGALDFGHRFGHNMYNLSGSVGFSRISGDTLAIQRAQRAPSRYYQRPDADYIDYDPSRTSLSGWTGVVTLGKEAGAYQGGITADATSPGFEVNDAGFETSADDIDFYGFVNRRWTKPNKITRFFFIGNNLTFNRNFGWVRTGTRYNFNTNATFLNYWGADAHFTYNWRSLNDTQTRGGPLVYLPGIWNVSGGLASDFRKPLGVSVFASFSGNDVGGSGLFLNSEFTIRPSPRVNASIGPSWSRSNAFFQYIQSQDDATATTTFGRSYIFSQVRQRTLDLTTRLNVTFTPTVSLQLYTQPFVATGDFYRFKELARAHSMDYTIFGETPGSTVQCFDDNDVSVSCSALRGGYAVVDPDGSGPRPSVTVDNPDFHVRSLQGNAVMRWEYRPGSTLFLVWTSNCGASTLNPQFSATNDIQHLCRGQSNNVFALKMNYWLSF